LRMQGVGPEARVGLCFDKSVSVLVSWCVLVRRNG
jgi:hypothetical protein